MTYSYKTLGLVLLLGCGITRPTPENLSPSQRVTTVLLVNEGSDVIRIYDNLGRIATIMPGRVRCVKLYNSSTNMQLSFSLVGKHTRWYAVAQDFGGGRGWIWRINSQMPIQSTITIVSHYNCIPGAEGSIRDVRR